MGGNGKIMSLKEARRLTPPVPPEEALRRNLATKLLGSISEADVAALGDAIKKKALAGDQKSIDTLLKLITTPIAGPRREVIEVDARPRRESLPGLSDGDRRASKGRQLAEMLAGGRPVMFHKLAAKGMTRQALDAALAESPDWFRDSADGVTLTERGRLELLGGKGAAAADADNEDLEEDEDEEDDDAGRAEGNGAAGTAGVPT